MYDPFRPSRPGKRGERVVTIVGRDAVDAEVFARRAATNADGEVVWSWRPFGWRQAREMMISRVTVTKKSWTPGRARNTP